MKNTITKRFLSLAMALAMIVGFAGLVPESINVEAVGGEITQAEVVKKLDSLVAKYNGTSQTWSYNGGSQCYAFAHIVFNSIFDIDHASIGSYSSGTEYKFNSINSNVYCVGTLAPGYSDSQLENLLDSVRPGDYILLKRRTSGGPHSEIVRSIDPENNNITIFDANTDGKNTVMVYTQHYFNNGTKLSFKNWNQGVSVYRFKKYITDDPIPKPEMPTFTVKAISTNSIKISWNSVEYAAYYRIDRLSPDSSQYEQIATTDKLVYTDAGLVENQKYKYRVYAVNDSGTSDKPEGMVAFTTKPATPVIESAEPMADGTAAVITWRPANYATAFNIMRKESTETEYSIIDTVDDSILTYKDTGLTQGKKYNYKIKAFNGSIKSEASESVIVDTSTPTVPEIESAEPRADGTAAIITWKPSYHVTAYNVMRKHIDESEYSIIATVDSNTLSYKDTGLTQNTKYKYKIKAFNGTMKSEASEPVTVDTSIPTVPEIESAEPRAEGTAAIITWKPSYHVTAYNVMRKHIDESEYSIIATVDSNTLSYKDTGLTQNTKYKYKIKAFNGTMKSEASEPVTVVTSTPGVPLSKNAILQNDGTSVEVSWEPANNALAYNIMRKADGENEFSIIATVDKEISTYIDNGLSPNITYIYKIKAFNGTMKSDASSHMIVTTVRPERPEFDLTAINENEIMISWNSVNYATSYRIDRMGPDDDRYLPVNTVSASGATDNYSFTDKGLSVNSKYKYRVYAINGNCFSDSKEFPQGKWTKDHNYNAWIITEPATCETDGEQIRTCSVCKITEQQIIPATGHSFEASIVSPTCTEKGYTIHKCSVCEEEYKDSYTDALGHDYKAEVTKAVTCTEDGEKTYTCIRCKDSYTEPIKAEGHKYETTTVAPTDTEAGYDEHVCSVCGDTYRDNIIPAKGHNYTSEVTKEPTCTEDGIMTYTCDCGDSYIEPIKALGHSYVDVVIDPTCTAKGYTVHKCSVCKYEYKDSYTAALGHNYKVEMTKPATCTEDGTMTYTCLCGDSYTEPILATGHSWKAPTYEWSEDGKTCTATRVCANNPSHKETETVNSTSVIKIAATCTEMGTTTYTVEYENTAFSTQTKDIQDIAATGHSYVPEVSKSATCTENGLMTYTCSCGDSYTETIEAIGHKYVNTVVDPTCTESGYTLHRCSACGDSYKDTYTFPIGHSYTSKVTKAATCTTDGVRTYLCTECGDTYTETITATGHQYEVKVIAPTTEAQGYTEHTCSVCGDSYRDNYTDKLPYTDITTCTITLSTSSYTYDGTAKKPTVTVKNGSTVLKSGTDYTVAYKNNISAGTATVTITGKGSYTGTASKTFTIKKASIANFAATLSVSTYTYNGSAKKPTVTVKNGSKTLTSFDYSVAYKNNTAVGTATVTVTGKGNYSGTLSKTFTINLANVTGFKNVAVSANAIKFTWNKVSGADGYVVYLYNKNTKQWQRYGKTTGGNNVQLVNKLNPGEAYALTARAYKTVNGKEVLSPSFTNFKTSTNPAKVSFSVTSKAKGSATYSWKKVTGATSYALYYKASSSASWTKAATVSSSTTSYTKTGLKSGTGYFTVRAFRTYEGTTYGSAFDTKTASVK